jgi:hypothetical protein
VNLEFTEDERRTKWGTVLDRELPGKLFAYLREAGTPLRTKDIASAFANNVLEVEAALDLLAAAKLVSYIPIEGKAWAWIAVDRSE